MTDTDSEEEDDTQDTGSLIPTLPDAATVKAAIATLILVTKLSGSLALVASSGTGTGTGTGTGPSAGTGSNSGTAIVITGGSTNTTAGGATNQAPTTAATPAPTPPTNQGPPPPITYQLQKDLEDLLRSLFELQDIDKHELLEALNFDNVKT